MLCAHSESDHSFQLPPFPQEVHHRADQQYAVPHNVSEEHQNVAVRQRALAMYRY